jgi:UDP-GlcNAc:undecaprenyl-phosphate/decaprenyl-phosphate GlcNAc-1-phosphate transferase
MLYFFAFLIAFLVAICSTPLVKKLAIYIGAVDKPDSRKVHSKIMPRLGGLAIVFGATVAGLFIAPKSSYLPYLISAALVIVITGVLDDKYILPAKIKLAGQVLATFIVLFSGLKINLITLPIIGSVHLGFFGYLIAFFWIIGITNAVNLMDGLDGLAAGLSTLSIFSLMVISVLNGNIFLTSICLILIASSLGFLIFNFYPAKIFMGDTGALFLGFTLSIISLMSMNTHSNFTSLIVPVIILAVPIIDTLFAIIRRIINKQSITAPDKNHLHHCLLKIGYSHRTSVLIIYTFGLAFGISAILLTANGWVGTIILVCTLLIGLLLTAKIVGILEEETLTAAVIHTFKRMQKEKKSA